MSVKIVQIFIKMFSPPKNMMSKGFIFSSPESKAHR